MPLSLEVVAISKHWLPFRRASTDKRVKILSHFLLPGPEALVVPDGDVNAASRVSDCLNEYKYVWFSI